MKTETTQYGFVWGPATVERHISDDKKGWIAMGIKTAKRDIHIYVTKTGKVRIYDYAKGIELLPSTPTPRP